MAAQAKPERTALAMMESARDRLAAFLPPDVSVDRVIAATSLALNDPERGAALRNCSPESVVRAVAKIAQWGLEVGTTAHLVPFGANCTPVADYKGLAELMVASGAVRGVEAHVVYAGDEFDCEQGLDPKLRHVPLVSAKERGVIVGAYCILHFPFGRKAFDYMPAEEIEEVRQKYSKQWKSGALPAWYAKKTVVRRAAKLIPKNPRLAAVLARIDAVGGMEGEVLPELPAVPQRPALYAGATDVDMKSLTYHTCTPVDPNPYGVPDGDRWTPEQIAAMRKLPDPYTGELPLDDPRTRPADALRDER